MFQGNVVEVANSLKINNLMYWNMFCISIKLEILPKNKVALLNQSYVKDNLKLDQSSSVKDGSREISKISIQKQVTQFLKDKILVLCLNVIPPGELVQLFLCQYRDLEIPTTT